jgi:hypothetical protein
MDWLSVAAAGAGVDVWIKGTGFPECESNAQPPKKDMTLMDPIHVRRPIFSSFISGSLYAFLDKSVS